MKLQAPNRLTPQGAHIKWAFCFALPIESYEHQ